MYNSVYSAGYKPFHVIKILSGGERTQERERNGGSPYRPATAPDTRNCRPLVARCERLGRRSGSRRSSSPPALLPHHRAPNSLVPRQKFLLARQIGEASKSPHLNPRTAAPNLPKIATKTEANEMGKQSKRTRAPAPLEVPRSASQLVPPPAPQRVLPPVPQLFPPPPPPHLYWIPPGPPQSMAASSAPSWIAGLQQPAAPSSSAQGPCWAPPAKIGDSASPWFMDGNIDDSDPQTWYAFCSSVANALSVCRTS
jgi:hypothetical protein